MAKSRWSGAARPWPHWPRYMSSTLAPSVDTTNLDLTANAGGKVIFTGSLIWDDGGTHDAHIIHFRTGSATAVNHTLRVSLRDPDLTAGPPARDDGGVDQSATQVNPTATTNYSLTLGADRTSVASGTELCIVWDYSAYTAGSIRIAGLGTLSSSADAHRPTVTLYNGAAYSTQGNVIPSVTIEDATGTHFAILAGGMPCITAVNTHTFNSGSAADEFAMAFTVNEPLWASELGMLVTTVAGGDFTLLLYNGTSAIAGATYSVDANTWTADASVKWVHCGFPDVALTVGNTYYLSMKPTTATNVTIYSVDVIAAGHLKALAGTMQYSTRVDAGSWAAITTTRTLIGYVGLCGSDDAAGSATLYPSSFISPAIRV